MQYFGFVCVCCVSLYECVPWSTPRGHESISPTCLPLSLLAYFSEAGSFLELETFIVSAKNQKVLVIPLSGGRQDAQQGFLLTTELELQVCMGCLASVGAGI